MKQTKRLEKIVDLLHQLGFRDEQTGFNCLAVGIDLVYTNKILLESVCNKLYPAISEQMNLPLEDVAQNLHAITKDYWNHDSRHVLEAQTGMRFLVPFSVGELLSYLTEYMRASLWVEQKPPWV